MNRKQFIQNIGLGLVGLLAAPSLFANLETPVPPSRKSKARWTPELEHDLQSFQGVYSDEQ
jgi:hypothetical protein